MSNAPQNIKKLLIPEYDFPFKLMVIFLVFNAFRPDRLLPGGNILMYFPILLIFLLLFQLLKEKKKIVSNIQTKLLLAFILLMIFQVPFARQRFWAFENLRTFLIYIFTGYLFKVQFIDTPFKVDKYLRLYIIFSIFFAIIGITGGGKVNLPVLGDENDFCLNMNLLLPFAFFLGQEANDKRKKIFYYSLVLIFILANLATFSRGGFIGLVAVGLFLIYKSKNKAITVLICTLFLLGVVFLAPKGYWDEMKTITKEGTEQGTGKMRFEYAKAGWKMFLDHPIIGVGALNYGMWLPEYWGYRSAHTKWGRVAHSLYFTLLSEMGIAGALLFIGMLWGNFKDHRFVMELDRRKDEILKESNLEKEEISMIRLSIRKLFFLSLGCTGAMFAYLVTGIFLSVLWYGYFWMLTAFSVVISNSARKIQTTIIASQTAGK